ncbi:MAG: hypothetical protein AAB316_22090 [Bacteroidota bacterium]
MKYLFPNFLQSKKAHDQNEAFYKQLFHAVMGREPVPFFANAFANGKKIYDDHIFNTKFGDRIVQVIQRTPSPGGVPLTAFVKKWDGELDLLVLTVELSEEILPALKKLIKAWLVGLASPEEIDRLAENAISLIEKNKKYRVPLEQAAMAAEPVEEYKKGKS